LAVAYSNGHLKLLAVEDAKKIFSFNCNEPISYLYWLQESDEMASKHETHSFYEDISATQLPKPISYDMISQLFEKTNNKDFSDNLFIKETKNLTYLVCAHGTSIAIFVYGYFLLVDANLDIVPSYLNYKQLQACFLSDNTSLISTLGLTDENLLVYSLLDARILQDNHIQIKMISTKFGMLFSMLTSVKSVIKEMEELWEDILVEMDQKFQLYALEKFNNANKSQTANSADANNQPNLNSLPQMAQNQNNDGSLVNDFMMLYAFGTCSEHFKNFLLNELTEKGLKKLESSVENYYSNIQRLLSGNFHQ
jgi:anaphase-promoting complex subunit 4